MLESKAHELVNYVRMMYRLQEPWMKERVKVVADNVGELKLSNGSRNIGIPQGANQFRSHHPHGVVFDEASHLTDVDIDAVEAVLDGEALEHAEFVASRL